jgi:WD40 repeat protein
MNARKQRIATTLLGLAAMAASAAWLTELAQAQGQEASASKEGAASPREALPAGAVRRLGTTRFRTGSRILCVAFSPDGKILATGGGDDPVRLWDAETGKEIRQLKDTWVFAIAFSPNGQTIATGGGFKTVRLWNAATGQEIGSPLKGHEGTVKALVFSPDGLYLASAGQDKSVRVWGLGRDAAPRICSGNQDEVNALAFSPDGKTLASGGGDRTVRLWEVPSCQPIRQLNGGGAVAAVVFAPDGKTLASAGDDALIRLWDVERAAEIRQLRGHEQSILTLLFARDGRTLISGGLDRGIRFWDASSGQEVRQIPHRPGDVDALALSPDGRILAAAGTNNTLQRWDAATGRPLSAGPGHQSGITSLAVAFDGKQVVSAAAAGTIRFWDAVAGKHVRESAAGLPGDALVAWTPDAKTIVLADGTNKVYLLEANRLTAGINFMRACQKILDGPKDDSVLSLAVSSDGKLIATGYRKTGVRLWNASDGAVVQSFPFAGPAQALALAPDGKTLAVGGMDTIALFETATAKPLRQLEKGQPVACLVFSPDGSLLASAMVDSTIRLWDLRPGIEQGKELRVLEGHTSAVYSLAFAPDGRTLVSGSHDRTVRSWETASGNQIHAWSGHLGPVTAVGVIPGGRGVASGSADTTVLLWDVTGRSSDGKVATVKISAAEMDGLWLELASEEAPRAHKALWTLVAGAADCVPLLETKDRVFLVDPEHIQGLLRDLNDNKFAVRERAHGKLAGYGRWIEGVLDDARKKPPSEEVRRRVEKLLAKLQVPGSISLAQERLRARRLMAALEQSDTPAARELLRKLARQAAEADLRAEAQASLTRMNGKQASP